MASEGMLDGFMFEACNEPQLVSHNHEFIGTKYIKLASYIAPDLKSLLSAQGDGLCLVWGRWKR